MIEPHRESWFLVFKSSLPTWGKGWGRGENHAVDIKVDNANNVYIIGATKHNTEGYNALLVKFNSLGIKQWDYTYHSSNAYDDYATALDVDASGNCYITGASTTATHKDAFTIKVDNTGNNSFTQTYDYDSFDDGGIFLEYVNNNEINSVAITQDDGGYRQLSKLTYNSSGILQSSYRTNIGYGNMRINDLKTVGNGYVVCGAVENINGDWDFAVYSLNSSMLANWSYIHDENGYDDEANALVVDGSGNVYCGGGFGNSVGSYPSISKLNSSGTEIASWEYEHYSNTTIEQVGLTGNKVLCMTFDENETQRVILLNNNFEEIWENKQTSCEPIDIMGESAVSFIYSSLDLSNDQIEVNSIQLFNEKTTVFTQTNGNTIIDNQLVVKFWPDIVKTTFTDNLNTEFCSLEDAISAVAFNTFSANIDSVEWDSVVVRKVFSNSTSVGNTFTGLHGYDVKMNNYHTTYVLYFNNEINEASTKNKILNNPNLVIYSEENGVIEFNSGFNDEFLDEQPGLVPNSTIVNVNIGMEGAWDIEKGREDIIVGVWDTGISWSHEDFSTTGTNELKDSKIKGGYSIRFNKDFIDVNDKQADVDTEGHGTRMAGLLGAISNNEKGGAGVAGGDATIDNFGVSLYSFQFGDATFGFVSSSKVADWLAESTTESNYIHHVANHSWSNSKKNVLAEGFYTSYTGGIVQCASSSNNGNENEKCFPADFNDWIIIQTGAINSDKERASFSDYGFNLDLIAPGVNDLFTAPHVKNSANPSTDSYTHVASNPTIFRGTSEATAHVSGVAALLLSYWNDENANDQNLFIEDVEYLLEIGSEDIEYNINQGTEIATVGYDKYTGWGLTRADRSLQYLAPGYFDLQHVVEIAGSGDVSLHASNIEIEVDYDYCYSGLEEGKYIADVYKVVVDARHTLPNGHTLRNVDAEHPGYWLMNSMSNLWDYDETTKITKAANGVKFTAGNTPDATSAQLVGYFFYIKEKVRLVSNKTINMWYPHSNTDEHRLAYGLHSSKGFPLGVKENNLSVAIYPNPASKQVSIISNINEKILGIKLFSIEGKLIDDVSGLDVENYEYYNQYHLKGVYIFEIETEKGKSFKRIVFE
ncbi:MAG: S8 family serine peptidase [Bacteroidia bacterium]